MATGRVPTTANSPLTTKGDLFGYSTAPARLAVGADGEQIVADSSTATGLRYQAPKTQNAIYNSGFDIAQRGTSFTGLSGADYTLDRWVIWSQTGGQSNYASQQSVGNLSVTPNQALRYCGRFGRTNGTTNIGTRSVFQTLETNDSIRFAGQTITFSFYARAGANFSATSSLIDVSLVTGTGTDQIYYSFTGSSAVISSTATLTTSWQRFTYTGTVATTATELAVRFGFTPSGTAGAADYIEVTGVQLEVGSVATPYNRMSGTIQGELAACQRYFANVVPSTADYGTVISMFQAASSTTAKGGIRFPVPMRTSASITLAAATNFTLANATYTPIGGSSFTYALGNTVDCRIDMSVASGLVAGNATALSGNTANLLIQASAEL